jgi:hypothetical protein
MERIELSVDLVKGLTGTTTMPIGERRPKTSALAFRSVSYL